MRRREAFAWFAVLVLAVAVLVTNLRGENQPVAAIATVTPFPTETAQPTLAPSATLAPTSTRAPEPPTPTHGGVIITLPTTVPTATPTGLRTEDVIVVEAMDLDQPLIPVGTEVEFAQIMSGELTGFMAVIYEGKYYYLKGVAPNFYPWEPNKGYQNYVFPVSGQRGIITDYVDWQDNANIESWEADGLIDIMYVDQIHAWTALEQELLGYINQYAEELRANNWFELSYGGLDCRPRIITLDGETFQPGPYSGVYQLNAESGVLRLSGDTCTGSDAPAEEIVNDFTVRAGEYVQLGTSQIWQDPIEVRYGRDPWSFCLIYEMYGYPGWQPIGDVSFELQQRCGLYSRNNTNFESFMRRYGFEYPYSGRASLAEHSLRQFYGAPYIKVEGFFPAHRWEQTGTELDLPNGEKLTVYALGDDPGRIILNTSLTTIKGEIVSDALGSYQGLGEVYIIVPKDLAPESPFNWGMAGGFRIVEDDNGQPVFERLVWTDN